VLGALLCTVLIPGVSVGQGLGAPGTFAPAAGLSNMGVFAWEAIMTAALGLVVYGCAVVNSAFKAAAPVGIGLVVTCAIMAGRPLTLSNTLHHWYSNNSAYPRCEGWGASYLIVLSQVSPATRSMQ
jgi:hypothetical protein